MAKKVTATEEPLEKQLWKAADKLRKNIDAAEYKHVVLGFIFLKYIPDAFLNARLKTDEDAELEDIDDYCAENVFLVPQEARWFIYGQESNQTTWRLCKMNLAIRGIDSSQVKWNYEVSFLNDEQIDLQAGRYVGFPDEEDDFNLAERFFALKAELEEQMKEEERLNEVINKCLDYDFFDLYD